MNKIIVAKQDNINNKIIFNVFNNDEKIEDLIINLYDFDKYKDNILFYLWISYYDKIIDIFLLEMEDYYKNNLISYIKDNKNNLNLSLVDEYISFLKEKEPGEYEKKKIILEGIKNKDIHFLSELKPFSNQKILDSFIDSNFQKNNNS